MAKSNDNLCFLFVANISSFDAAQKRISSNVPNVNCNHIATQNTFFGIWKVAFFFKIYTLLSQTRNENNSVNEEKIHESNGNLSMQKIY